MLSGRDVRKALGRIGFVKVGQTGSHVRLKRPNGRIVMVPEHAEIAVGTLRSIIRQAGLTQDGFLRLL